MVLGRLPHLVVARLMPTVLRRLNQDTGCLKIAIRSNSFTDIARGALTTLSQWEFDVLGAFVDCHSLCLVFNYII